MHQYILIKVYAHTADDARDIVTDIIDETIGDSQPFDYCGGIYQCVKEVTDKETQTGIGNKTYQQIEKEYKEATLSELNSFKQNIKNALIKALAPKHLPKKEVPLYLDREDIKETLETILKSKEDNKLPGTFEELIDTSTSTIFELQKTDGMFSWYLSKINEILKSLAYPKDIYATLYTCYNYFVEINEKEKGMKTFYFLVDRHQTSVKNALKSLGL